MMNALRNFWVKTAGATAIAFALLIPIVVGSAGIGVDLATAYMVRQRLSHALDAAALAAAATGATGDELQGNVQKFVDMNYPPEKIGAAYDLSVQEMSGGRIQVSAHADFDPYFIELFGINFIDVYADTTVNREVRGLEVAMVLDVTGSMSSNNNIGTLRTAATNFVNILFDRAVYDDNIKIGIVPYATAVNVGPYGLGKKPDNSFYDTPFINNPNNRKFNQSKSTDWWGCALEANYPSDTNDGTASSRWDMYSWTFINSNNSEYRKNYKTLDPQYGPNYGCNKAYIRPLTSSKSALISTINSLKADGNTYGNIGMVWGYRLISPDFPFREGAAWDDKAWRKAVVMMTDGDNVINEHYNAYGPYRTTPVSVAQMNARFEETCTKMKAQGIKIYTITFTSGINNTTRGFYRRCATDESKYYNAPDQADLIDAFERISLELSNIHISQ
jgi:Flp pilus assembly protein TadG